MLLCGADSTSLTSVGDMPFMAPRHPSLLPLQCQREQREDETGEGAGVHRTPRTRTFSKALPQKSHFANGIGLHLPSGIFKSGVVAKRSYRRT